MAITETQIRRLVQDNPGGGGTDVLATADYELIIATETNILRAGAMAARMIASTFAEKVQVAAGSAKIELQDKYQHYIDLANRWDNRAREGGGGGGILPVEFDGVTKDQRDDIDEDTDRVQPYFSTDMFQHDETQPTEKLGADN